MERYWQAAFLSQEEQDPGKSITPGYSALNNYTRLWSMQEGSGYLMLFCIVSNRTEFTARQALYTYYTTPGHLTADASFISENYSWLGRPCTRTRYCTDPGRAFLETGDLTRSVCSTVCPNQSLSQDNQLSIEICAVLALARHALTARSRQKPDSSCRN